MILFLSFFILGTLQSEAASFQITGVAGEILLQTNVEPLGTVGKLTDQILGDSLKTGRLKAYSGSDGGVVSINRLGGELEVLSDTEMNAYGWCYLVDGVVSGIMADQYKLTGKEKAIKWFYAYAHLKREVWTAMCMPAQHVVNSD